jgi:type IV secretory pathway VirB3-like protein
MIGGLFLTSAVFYELQSPDTAFLTLTLPATSFEKMASAWLITSVLYTIVSAVLYLALVLILHVFSMLYIASDVPFSLYQLSSNEVGQTLVSYFGYQSVFLLGAVVFRKNNFLKTLLSLIIFTAGLFILLGFFFLIFGGSSLEGSFTFQFSTNDLFTTLYPIFNILIVLVILTISYIRLKNKQVA